MVLDHWRGSDPTDDTWPASWAMVSIVRCHYNVVDFLQNPQRRHIIACPSGWNMRCIFFIQMLISILPQSLQWYMQYHVLLACIIMSPGCFLEEKKDHTWGYHFISLAIIVETLNINLVNNLSLEPPNHYLNQWCLIDIWTLKDQTWNLNQNMYIFGVNVFENVICKMIAILFKPLCTE